MSDGLILDLPDPSRNNVISIEVVRKHRYNRTCHHHRVRIDADYAKLFCKDCENQLNPVEWLATMVQEWARIKRLREEYNEAAKLYEEKKRTQCEHCGEMTKVNPPTDFARRLRERQRKSGEAS